MLHEPMVHEFVAGILGLVAGGFFLTTIGFAAAWIRARERAVRAERAAGDAVGAPGEHLMRIEQAVEAVAIEVERLAEAERFQAKLLAARQQQSELPPSVQQQLLQQPRAAGEIAAPPQGARAALPGRTITPH